MASAIDDIKSRWNLLEQMAAMKFDREGEGQ